MHSLNSHTMSHGRYRDVCFPEGRYLAFSEPPRQPQPTNGQERTSYSLPQDTAQRYRWQDYQKEYEFRNYALSSHYGIWRRSRLLRDKMSPHLFPLGRGRTGIWHRARLEEGGNYRFEAPRNLSRSAQSHWMTMNLSCIQRKLQKVPQQVKTQLKNGVSQKVSLGYDRGV